MSEVISSIPSFASATVEDFAAEAREFFDARWPRREDSDSPAPFEWGVGSDVLNLFPDVDLETERSQMDEVRRYRRALYDAGFGWADGPTDFGGGGLSRQHAVALEELARQYEVPGDSLLTVSLGTVAPTILKHGNDEQRQRWLPQLYRADLVACQLFSEPGAGSDLASISTRAVPEGKGWRISGQKVWTSGAHLADRGQIVARTAEEPRYHNLTAFVVDMTSPGVEVRPLRQMTGTASFNEVFLTDVWVPDADRLDDVGEGWRVAITTLGNERSAIGHSAFGGLGVLRMDRLIAMLRHTGLDRDPVVRQRFATLYSHIRVARYTQERLLAEAKESGTPGPELSMTKLALARNLTRLADFVASVVGPKLSADNGEWGIYAWTALLLGAPGYHIGGGTDEVMQNILAERVLGLPR